jgi:dolichol-phosphate mannosyltransferase
MTVAPDDHQPDQPTPARSAAQRAAQADAPVAFSVVAPAHNEEGNIPDLVDRVGAACASMGLAFEFIVVDDGSTDATRARVLEAMATRPWLRCVAMTGTPAGKGHGQSAAFHAGFRAARGDLIAVLDADLQNDPADYPALYEAMRAEHADFVQGDRSAARREGDAWIRQVGSIVGRKFRLWLLGDRITDTGCSLRIMKREIALALPLEFKGAHRFIPAMANQLGYKVIERPVSHHHRLHGETKYGMGIMKRAIPGLLDCFAMRWMKSRRRPTTHTVFEAPGPDGAAAPADRADAPDHAGAHA